jgi:DNA-directed RNA polymerase specialized sigma24 family protein
VAADPSEGFALFFKNNRGPVFRVLLAGTLSRAAAEDATAEAFARAFASWDRRRWPRTRGQTPI